MPDLGRMFVKLKYTDITKKHLYPKLNGYGDKRREESVVFLRFHVLYLVRVTYYPYTAHVRPCLQPAQARSSLRLHM